MIISIVDMKPGEVGTITEIQGGQEATRRIQGMGIRIGKKIEKQGSHFWRGPQRVLVDSFKVAIGFGMAEKVFIKVERNGNK